MATQTGNVKQVLEIDTREQDGGPGSPNPYQVSLGSEVRIIFGTPTGIGAQNYEVNASGSVESVEQDRVTTPRPLIGSMRTDIILNAKSLGSGAAKVRALGANGKDLGTADFLFDVVAATDES